MDENDQLRDLVQGLERRLASRAPKEREAKAKERAQREVRARPACTAHSFLGTSAHNLTRVSPTRFTSRGWIWWIPVAAEHATRPAVQAWQADVERRLRAEHHQHIKEVQEQQLMQVRDA